MAEPSKCFMAGLGAVYTPPKRPFSGSNVSTTSQGGLGVGSMALPGIIERYIPPTGPFPLDSLFSNDATQRKIECIEAAHSTRVVTAAGVRLGGL